MSSDTRRGRKRRRRPPVPPVREPVTPPPPAPRSPRDKIQVAVLLLGSFVWAGLFVVADETGRAYVDLARAVTGGQVQAMAIAGWLIYFAPFGAVLGLALRGMRLTDVTGATLGAVGAALIPVALHLTPMLENTDLREIITGVGGDGFVSGLLNAALAGWVSVSVVAVFATGEQVRAAMRADAGARWTAVGVIGTFVVATLIAALVLA